jgi:hypothetical protein
VSTECRDASADEAAWAWIRTIIVPTGIAPVERRSPVPYRKRTPLRKHPDGEATSRLGGRDWFSDHVFVEPQQGHKRAGFGAALTVHVIVADPRRISSPSASGDGAATDSPRKNVPLVLPRSAIVASSPEITITIRA